MGILKRPKYQETETDKMIKRQIAEEEKKEWLVDWLALVHYLLVLVVGDFMMTKAICTNGF